MRALLGDYPPEPVAEQPSKPPPGEPDEYNADRDLWRTRLRSPNFPVVTFDDIDDNRQKAFRDRLGDRLKTVLGISGVTGFAFDLLVKPKIDKLLRGHPA